MSSRIIVTPYKYFPSTQNDNVMTLHYSQWSEEQKYSKTSDDNSDRTVT